MSKQDDEPHLRHMFTHFVTRHGIQPSSGASPPSPGPPVYPPTPPPPLQLPALAPPSSSARRRTSSYDARSVSSTSASKSISYPARPLQRRRTSLTSLAPIAGTGVSADIQAYPHTPPPQSQPQIRVPPFAALTSINSSQEPPGVQPVPAPPRPYGVKTFPCPVCPSIFDQRGQLSRHVKRVHEKLRPFACEHCGRLFAARSDRTRHVGIVHKDGRDGGGRGR